jgi:hypothetical protein
MDDAPIVKAVRGIVGELTDDEAALVRTLTPADLTPKQRAEHLGEVADMLETMRSDEAIADYVYAIAPSWDSTIESLLLGARVTTIFTNLQVERRAFEVAA